MFVLLISHNRYSQSIWPVVSNPPYIKTRDINYLDDGVKMYEPEATLDGGNDGLDLIKKVI